MRARAWVRSAGTGGLCSRVAVAVALSYYSSRARGRKAFACRSLSIYSSRGCRRPDRSSIVAVALTQASMLSLATSAAVAFTPGAAPAVISRPAVRTEAPLMAQEPATRYAATCARRDVAVSPSFFGALPSKMRGGSGQRNLARASGGGARHAPPSPPLTPRAPCCAL